MKGYVYKLWSLEGDDIYIGSTKEKYLSSRLSHHKSKFNKCRSRELFEKYQDVKIECLEVVEFNDIVELRAKEGEYQRKLKCINYQIANHTRTQKEDQEKCKKYYYKNHEKMKERARKDHCPENNERHKLWSKELITCVCGCKLAQGSLYLHLKTNKHFKMLELVK